MKRIVPIIIVLSMLLALSACGNTDAGTEPDVTEPDVTEPDTTEPDTAEPDTAEPDTAEPDATEPDTTTEPDDTAAEPDAVPDFELTRENMPIIDGSTSTAPLAVAMCAELLGENEDEVQDLVNFNRTTQSYYNLIDGASDLLIVAESNDDVETYRSEKNFEWVKEPFATDAFVFVVNENNPVNSITVEQARQIYSGEITNWKDVGGEDAEIIAIQRNSGAGSQTLMEKLVMDGTPMMDAPTEYIIDSMGGLMDAVKGYDGSPYAIGYSVYYYADEMRMAQGLKLLSVDGVEPTAETIRSGEYTLTNPYYVVIPADRDEDSAERYIMNWLLSEDGQKLASDMGYVSVMDFPVEEKETGTITVGTRLSDDYMPELVPSDDYGILIPYAGRRSTDDWPALSGCFYGLMTQDGCAVTDAVYSTVVYGEYFEKSVPVMFLTDAATGKIAAAGSNGSWCTEFLYSKYGVSSDIVLLYGEDTLTIMTTDGNIESVKTYDEWGITDEELSQIQVFEGIAGELRGKILALGWVENDQYDTVRYLDLETGESGEMPYDDWWVIDVSDYTEPECPYEGGYYVPDLILRENGKGIFNVWSDGKQYWYNEDGEKLPFITDDEDWATTEGGGIYLYGGLVGVIETNQASYYDLETSELVFRAWLGYEAD